MGSKGLVWFKRDLRTRDHAALAAAAHCTEACGLYIVEPEWLASGECDAQHLAFASACIDSLRQDLAALGMPLLVRVGSACEVLHALHSEYAFTALFSHEETGPGWSYARDLAVGRWCKTLGVPWQEFTQTGVVRRLGSRSGWAARWQERMDGSQYPVPQGFRAPKGLVAGHFPTLVSLQLPAPRPVPAAGEHAASAVLSSFLSHRGSNYRKDLSSPVTAESGCSRLSAHLAFGTLSMRQVHQATEAQITALIASGATEARSMAYHLRGFSGRLRWHCHFMQKLEDEPAIEHRNFSSACDGLREDSFSVEHFEAWRTGHTGFPMVDACMRSLNATGWLNFRMRAMLVSFASYQLWLHWRLPGQHLARQFLDFEAGIHWSQMQMQSGTTGINTLRMYSPAKQALDHDPEGIFVRRWVPELGTKAYPPPIVDARVAMQEAKTKMYGLRQTPEAKAQSAAIQHKHGSRKSGLAQSGARRKTAPKQRTTELQQNLFA